MQQDAGEQSALEDHTEQLLDVITVIWEFEWLLINAILYWCDSFSLQRANSHLTYNVN